MILLAGALAGGAVGAFNGLWWAILGPLFATPVAEAQWRVPTLSRHLLSILVHLFAGLGLGALFWLSWGLAAVVNVPWWKRGLSFALLAWLVLAIPVLVSQALTVRLSKRLAVKTAVEWLFTCSAVGLACAWSWRYG